MSRSVSPLFKFLRKLDFDHKGTGVESLSLRRNYESFLGGTYELERYK